MEPAYSSVHDFIREPKLVLFLMFIVVVKEKVRLGRSISMAPLSWIHR